MTSALLTVGIITTCESIRLPPRCPSSQVSRLVLGWRVPRFFLTATLAQLDTEADPSGGPGYTIRDEVNLLRYTRGAVGMALAGPDTARTLRNPRNWISP